MLCCQGGGAQVPTLPSKEDGMETGGEGVTVHWTLTGDQGQISIHSDVMLIIRTLVTVG